MSNSRWATAALLAALVFSNVAATAWAGPFVYVLARQSGTPRPNVLTVIDAATNTKGPRITLGTSNGFILPQAMAMAPDGSRVYVINDFDETVSVVSTATNTVVDTWPAALSGAQPRAIVTSPDGQRVYIGARDGVLTAVNVVARARLAGAQLNQGSLFGLAVSPDGSRVYAMATGAERLLVVGTAPFGVLATLFLDLNVHLLRGDVLSSSPDGRYLYLPQFSTYVDPCGGNPNCIPITPPGGTAPTRVSVYDTATNAIVASTNVGQIGGHAYHAGASPDGAVVYAPVYDGALVRLNPATFAVQGSTPMSKGRAVTFLADSSRAYVATDTSVVVVDTATNAVTATVPFAAIDGVPNAIVTAPPPPPGPPSNLRATVTGNRVSLLWDAPAGGGVAGYVLEAGATPGSVQASIPTGQSTPGFTVDAPSGAYFVRIHATGVGGRSPASNEIQVLVNVPVPPSAPTGLRGLANGSELALSWTNTSAGGSPSSLLLDVSGALTLSLALPVTESFSYAVVPPGTYTFAVRAVNESGASAPSAPVTVAFPGSCPGAPQAPANFAVTRVGAQLTAAWDPPAGGEAVTGYVLNVTGALSASLPLTGRTISGVVAPGTYQLSVLAVNPCGSGPSTPVQAVTVP